MRFRELVWLAGLALLPTSAQALCTSFGVTATALNFDVYDPAAGAATAAAGTVTVQCGIGLLPSFSVALSKGGGTYAQRVMANGADALKYNLYADSMHMTVWGDGTDGTVTQSLTGIITLGSTNYTVFGLVGAGQYPTPGTYSDSITVMVNF
jgi:spore coat protein U-like protein